jgi:biotin transport system substrate-specific component
MIRFLFILIAAVACGVASQIAIPLSENTAVAPVTAQTLAILMIVELMNWKDASISIVLYLLLGIVGLPLFSDFSGGWDVFTGPSLGYFIGFLITAIFIGKWSDIGGKSFGNYFLRMLVGSMLILFAGYIGLFRYLDFKEALIKGVLPFLPGALIKIVIGAALISLIKRFKNIMSDPELKH